MENCEKCGGTWCAGDIELTIDDIEGDNEDSFPWQMGKDGNEDSFPWQMGKDDNEEEDGQRYIVKFKGTADDRAKARRMESRALKEQLIAILPKDNVEVLRLTSEEEVRALEDRDDVDFVEKGKCCTSLLYLLYSCFVSHMCFSFKRHKSISQTISRIDTFWYQHG